MKPISPGEVTGSSGPRADRRIAGVLCFPYRAHQEPEIMEEFISECHE